jgi:hypothetical protein
MEKTITYKVFAFLSSSQCGFTPSFFADIRSKPVVSLDNPAEFVITSWDICVSPIAQPVERAAVNRQVVGSNPTRGVLEQLYDIRIVDKRLPCERGVFC